MEIKIDNLWCFRGVEVIITEELSDEHLPKGTYTFVTRESYGELRLYNSTTGFAMITEWDDDSTVTTYDHKNYKKRVEKLVEAQAVLCIDLIGDGWSQDTSHFDLSPYLDDLKSYKRLQSILEAEEKL